jgi:choice-of-anchor A domain-containing protein
VTFDASDSNNQKLVATGTGLLVYNMTEAEFEAIGQNAQLLITVPDGVTLVINVSGVDIDLAGKVNRFTNDSNVIWNFYQATTIDIAQQFSGSVLGVFADITVGNSGNIDGTVVGNNIVQNANGEIHNNYFKGDLSSLTATVSTAPEPATWMIMILGFGMIGWRLRKGKQAAQSAGRPIVA